MTILILILGLGLLIAGCAVFVRAAKIDESLRPYLRHGRATGSKEAQKTLPRGWTFTNKQEYYQPDAWPLLRQRERMTGLGLALAVIGMALLMHVGPQVAGLIAGH